jgi:hypothetical protein
MYLTRSKTEEKLSKRKMVTREKREQKCTFKPKEIRSKILRKKRRLNSQYVTVNI